VFVAAWLYVTYTKPELVPGHRNPATEHPMIFTAVPGQPAADDGENDDGENKAKSEAGE
jgi:hypothetical protein